MNLMKMVPIGIKCVLGLLQDKSKVSYAILKKKDHLCQLSKNVWFARPYYVNHRCNLAMYKYFQHK